MAVIGRSSRTGLAWRHAGTGDRAAKTDSARWAIGVRPRIRTALKQSTTLAVRVSWRFASFRRVSGCKGCDTCFARGERASACRLRSALKVRRLWLLPELGTVETPLPAHPEQGRGQPHPGHVKRAPSEALPRPRQGERARPLAPRERDRVRGAVIRLRSPDHEADDEAPRRLAMLRRRWCLRAQRPDDPHPQPLSHKGRGVTVARLQALKRVVSEELVEGCPRRDDERRNWLMDETKRWELVERLGGQRYLELFRRFLVQGPVLLGTRNEWGALAGPPDNSRRRLTRSDTGRWPDSSSQDEVRWCRRSSACSVRLGWPTV